MPSSPATHRGGVAHSETDEQIDRRTVRQTYIETDEQIERRTERQENRVTEDRKTNK